VAGQRTGTDGPTDELQGRPEDRRAWGTDLILDADLFRTLNEQARDRSGTDLWTIPGCPSYQSPQIGIGPHTPALPLQLEYRSSFSPDALPSTSLQKFSLIQVYTEADYQKDLM